MGAIATVAAVVVGLVVGIPSYLTWRHARRRPEIVLEAKATPVVSVSSRDLTVLWNEVQVADPWLLRVRIENAGSADLESSRYDQARPISFSIGDTSNFVAILSSDGTSLWRLQPNETVAFGPELLAVGSPFEAEVLVSGEPEVSWEHHLVNVGVRHDSPRRDSEKMWRSWAASTTVAAAAATAAAIVSLLLSQEF